MRRTLVYGLSMALAVGWTAAAIPSDSGSSDATPTTIGRAAGKVGAAAKAPRATVPADTLVDAAPASKTEKPLDGPSLFADPLPVDEPAPTEAASPAQPTPADAPAAAEQPTPAEKPTPADAPAAAHEPTPADADAPPAPTEEPSDELAAEAQSTDEPTPARPTPAEKPVPKVARKPEAPKMSDAAPPRLEDQLETAPIDDEAERPAPAPVKKPAKQPAPKRIAPGVTLHSSRRAPGANEAPRTIQKADDATPIYNEESTPADASPIDEASLGAPLESAVIDEREPTPAASPSPRPAPAAQQPARAAAPATIEADEPKVAEIEETHRLELSPGMLALHQRIDDVLASYKQRHLNTRDHNHWEVMHQIVAWGCDTQIELGGPGGKLVNAISYQLYNNRCMGDLLMYTDRVGVQVRKGYKVQGHYGQFLGMMAQSRVPTNYPVRVDGKDFTLADIIETEKKTCVSRTELTFKLLSLSYYVKDTDETWTSSLGEKWNLQRLIKEEIAAPIAHDAACGGTHRLMGMAYAVHRRKLEGKPLTGEFGRARKYLDDFHVYTLKLQNRDGSFSTEWFRTRGNSPDIDRRLQTTGHILEWLVFSLPHEELQNDRVVAAVDYLTTIMEANPDRRWEIGPMGHALHGLVIYNQRVFGDVDPVQQSAAVANPAADAPTKRF